MLRRLYGISRAWPNRLCQARNVRTEVHACVVLLIDGLGHFTNSCSPTRSLRVGNRIATLLDKHARVDTRPALQLLVPPAGKPVLICVLPRSLGFHAVTLERSSFTENTTYFHQYPTLNVWYCLWSDSCLVK